MGAGRRNSRLPDWKPTPVIRDPGLLRRLHLEWRECALCGEVEGLSLHHICKHPRDDVVANLVMLCGDGVQGCHGLVEAHDPVTCALLGGYIQAERPDTVIHLEWRLGTGGALEWLRRYLWVDS